MKILLIVGLSVGFSGCAQKSKMENMTVKNLENTQYNSKFKSSIDILTVDGGEETNPAWTSEINNEEFKKALIASLTNAGLYSKDGKYRLTAEIIYLAQPSFGFDMTVTMSVKYTLLDFSKNRIIFTRTINKPYTATVSDAFSGVERLRLANEGSAKKNIHYLLKEFTEMKY